MKKCPYCAEDIQDTAIKCKHCGEWLEKDVKDSPPQVMEVNKIEPIKEQLQEGVVPTESSDEIERNKESGQKQCPTCGKWDVHTAFYDGGNGDWCPHCKKHTTVKKEVTGKKKGCGCTTISVVMLILLLAGAISTIFNKSSEKLKSSSNTHEAQSFPETSPPQKIDTPPPQPKKTSAELLKEAKKAINDKLESRPYGRLFDAEWRLKDIKPQDKEYMEAQKLLKEIDKISIGNSKESGEIRNKLLYSKRAEYAKGLERSYLSQGRDIYISVSGEHNTTIKFKWVLMSRPTVYNLVNETDTLDLLKNLGFKEVIFTDGYTTYSYNLTP